jgi:hypothetical protein
MDVRAGAPRTKTAVPGGRSPSVFILASGPLSQGEPKSQAGIEAGSNRKGNSNVEHEEK